MRPLRTVPYVALTLAVALASAGFAASVPEPVGTVPPQTGVPAVEPTSDPAATHLLADALGAPRLLSFVGRLSIIAWSSSGARAVEMEIEHRAPDLTRKWYIAPSRIYGNYVIERGSTTYAFDMHDRTLTLSHNPVVSKDHLTEASNFLLLTTNYRAVPGSDEELAGRRVHTLSLINRYTGVRSERVWIDAGTSLLLAQERYHADGSIAYSSRFQQIAYRDVPDALFRPSAPEGFKQGRGRDFGTPSNDLESALEQAGFSAVGPRYLPEGFALMSADVTSIKGIHSLHLLYTDGLRSLSLFENADPRGGATFAGLQTHDAQVGKRSATYVEDEPDVLLAWRARQLNLTLVGDLPLRELERIAASVAP